MRANIARDDWKVESVIKKLRRLWVLLAAMVAALVGYVVVRRRGSGPTELAAGCSVSCTCGGTNCSLAHIHCAYQNGPIGPGTPSCIVSCSGRCDGVLPVGHAGLHSCTHGHPF